VKLRRKKIYNKRTQKEKNDKKNEDHNEKIIYHKLGFEDVIEKTKSFTKELKTKIRNQKNWDQN
jgi:hypothetical protein